ncbi:MAG TPA: DUF3592 domain-containing protein [Anaerolineales bacterium]
MFLWMGIIFLLAALALLGGAIIAFFKQRSPGGRASADGTVVELVHRATTSGRASIICPVVEFTAPSGEKVRFTSDFGSLPARHTVGQSVKVSYDPADPHKAEIDSAFTRLLAPLILGFMGLIGCCLGTVFVVVYMLMQVPVTQ